MLKINNRRYIGNKTKLIDTIEQAIDSTISLENYSVADIFAGTGIVAYTYATKGHPVIVNDTLYSNVVVYRAILSSDYYDEKKLISLIEQINHTPYKDIEEILYLSHNLITAEIHNFDEFINCAINTYNEIFPINERNIKAFIYDTNKNRSVFEIIYCKLFNVSIPVIEVAKDLTQEEILAIGPIDATDENGAKTLNVITQSLKKLAKIQSNYKCCFDTCELCKYFTSKETHKPYLEIHHFIPREFANDFDSSIEIVENYATLCPNCHRKIHLAEDTERKHLINMLYSERKDVLSKHGLNVTLDQLYSYYKIDK